ncbi:Plasmodium exported protein, unknown function [Plasmodium sp. DRC-Itaito]|nr:Plasmodium exported protein, unknown function [Plasmodium sp. DRC-Itaito]
MLIKNGCSTKYKITNKRNPNDIHDNSKTENMNKSINYNIFNKIYKYILLAHLIIFICINNKNNHTNYSYDQYIYKNESFNKLQIRSLSDIHVNNDYSDSNRASQNTSNLRTKNIKQNDKQNKNNIKKDINNKDNINESLMSKPKNLEDLIFKKKREEAHLNEGKVLSRFDKIKCFLDIFDDFFIDKMIDNNVQKKDSPSLKLITENIVIHFMAFFPFSLPLFSRISNRLNFYAINHEKKKKPNDILHITDDKKKLYGVK